MERLVLLAVAFAAFCVWLTVRVVNRRERWAKWTLAVMVVTALFGYPLSFGPACWIMARRPGAPPAMTAVSGGSSGPSRPVTPPDRAMSVYYPLMDTLRRTADTNQIRRAMYWWMRVGMPRGTVVTIPDPTGGAIGLGSKDPIPASWRPSPNWEFNPPIWIPFVICPIGIALSIWYAPASAAICARLGRTAADPARWWVWRIRVAAVIVCVFGLVLGALVRWGC